jgi:hypothetical protein
MCVVKLVSGKEVVMDTQNNFSTLNILEEENDVVDHERDYYTDTFGRLKHRSFVILCEKKEEVIM